MGKIKLQSKGRSRLREIVRELGYDVARDRSGLGKECFSRLYTGERNATLRQAIHLFRTLKIDPCAWEPNS